MNDQQAISDGKRVKIHFTLTVSGVAIESTRKSKPLEYIQGKDGIVPGLQRKLLGRKSGDKCQIIVHPQEAFGDHDPMAVVEIPLRQLPEGDLRIGAVLHTKNNTGKNLKGIITNILEEKAVVDFNHPLAGKTLSFDVEVIQVGG